MIKDQTWISELALFIDILKYMNEYNLKLQGKNQFIPDMWYHIKTFEIKLKLYGLILKKMN